MLLDNPGRVRSQITSLVWQIQWFDFDCNLLVTRKLIIRIHAMYRRGVQGANNRIVRWNGSYKSLQCRRAVSCKDLTSRLSSVSWTHLRYNIL